MRLLIVVGDWILIAFLRGLDSHYIILFVGDWTLIPLLLLPLKLSFFHGQNFVSLFSCPST